MTTPTSTTQTPLSEPKLPLKFKWRRGRDKPFRTWYGESAVVMKGDVYFGGGVAPSVEDEQTVCVYSPRSDSWSRLPPCKYRYFSLTVINENKLVAVGGQDARTLKKTNKLAVWDDKQRHWVFSLPVMNTACSSPAVATYNQWLLVAGGGDEQGRLSRVEVMNVSSEQWFQAASLPVAGSYMSSTMIGNMWYLMGGITSNGPKTSVISICVKHIISEAISQPVGANSSTLSRWYFLLNTPLERSTALAFQGALLAVGGGSYSFSSSTIHLYQPSTSKWIKAGNMPIQRSMCACTVLPNGHIMIAGGDWGRVRVDIVHIQVM